MKSITKYITEKLKITKDNIDNDNLFQNILNIIKNKNLENIDRYNNGLLTPDLYLDENTLVDNIQFDETEITIFYTDDSNGDNELTEGDKSFGYDEWYDYFDEDMTKSIYDYLIKHIKNKML